MKRFLRKKLRALSNVRIKPKKLTMISVFALAIFAFSIIHAFADSEVIIKGTPKRASAEYTQGELVEIDIEFDTSKEWNIFGIDFQYDPNVFDASRANFKWGIKKYDGTEFDDMDDPVYLPDELTKNILKSDGRISLSGILAQDGMTYTGGIQVGTLRLPVRADAPGGSTTISFVDEIEDTPVTYLTLGDTEYTVETSNINIIISVPVETHGIDKDSLTLDINDNPTDTINVTFSPSNTTTPANISYTSNDQSVVTVDQNGLVTAVAPGSTTITVNEFGTTHEVPVTVTAKLKQISLDSASVELAKQGTHAFTVTTTPNPTTDTVTYNWTSSNESVATVSTTGVVTGLSAGITTITATAVVNGTPSTITASSTVTVVIPLTSVFANPNSISLKRGVNGENSATINVEYTPSEAAAPQVEWESLDDSIATVSDEGVVTAIGKGNTQIKGTVTGLEPFYVNVHVDVPMTGISTSTNNVELYIGQSQLVEASVEPIDTSENTTISWSSDDESVATVNNGTITAVGVGETTITATSGDNNDVETEITVKVYESIQSVTMSEANVTLYTNDGEANKKKTLTVNILPAGSGTVADREITWGSNDDSVATVTDGVVTAVGNGTTTISATLGNGTTVTCEVTVKTKVTSFTITNGTTKTLELNETHTIETDISPSTASDKTISWTSNDDTIATVSETGLVTGVGAGTTTIIGSVPDGKQVTFTITVKISATGIEINEGETYSILKGTTKTLTATKTPAESTDQITWSSSNPNVVSVGNTTGQISALKGGEATITATAGTKSDTILVSVEVLATGISINGNDTITINQGNTTPLSATVSPEDCTETVAWSTSDPSKVTVDENGVITAVSTGEADITATVGEFSDTVHINVILAATAIEITEGNSITMEKNTERTLHANVVPAGATDTINWSSSDTNKVTVDNTGKVSAIATGTAVIKAKVGNNVQDTITIQVVLSAESVTIDQGDSISIDKDEQITLTATVNPDGSTDTVAWSSNNTAVATVSETGVVTGVAKGEAVITATAGTKTDTITVTVNVPATSVTIAGEEEITIVRGETHTLSATVLPEGSSDTVVWSSSEPAIATVDQNGVVTGVNAGQVVITATAGDKVDTVSVEVIIPATSVTINGAEEVTVHRGEHTTLTAIVEPDGECTDELEWESSDPTIASVVEGYVTANKIGTVTITAKAGSKSDTVTVIVDAPVTSFTTDTDEITIIKGRSQNLTYTIEPSDATNADITWESTDPSKVTVDDTGKITGISAGTTTVTATAGGRSIVYTITVGIIPLNGIGINKTDFELRKGDTEDLDLIIDPEDSTEITDPVWESSDPTIAEVDSDGKVTGKRAGEVEIVVTMGSNFSDSVMVTVYEVPLTGISIANNTDNVAIGDTLTIEIQQNPTNATDEVEYTFESSDEEIATVDSEGHVKGLKNGTVIITVRTSNGLEDTIQLNIVTPQNIINPNTGVKSVIIFIISGICSLLGAGLVFKKTIKVK